MAVDGLKAGALKNLDTMGLATSNAEFAFDLYAQLGKGGSNLFFAPYSISLALAMALGGARSNTEAEMTRTLHLDMPQEQLHPALNSLDAFLRATAAASGVELLMANALWPKKDYAFLDPYLELIKRAYGASIEALDYGDAERARGIINTWAKERTQGKITDLIGKGILTTLTRLVLTNAVYFKGSWSRPFNVDNTRDAPFWITPDRAVDVSTMTIEAAFRFAVLDGLRLLELPYGRGDLSMLLMLPNHRSGLVDLEAALTARNLRDWLGRLRSRKVHVFLPRFRLTGQFSLKRALVSMGISDAFDMTEADFSGMDGQQRLYIAAALHKAFVDVNEEGTEAAASTAVVVAAKSIALKTPTFRADHPFTFLIRECRTGTILFLGRVVDPR